MCRKQVAIKNFASATGVGVNVATVLLEQYATLRVGELQALVRMLQSQQRGDQVAAIISYWTLCRREPVYNATEV